MNFRRFRVGIRQERTIREFLLECVHHLKTAVGRTLFLNALQGQCFVGRGLQINPGWTGQNRAHTGLATGCDLPDVSNERIIRPDFSQLLLGFLLHLKVDTAFRYRGSDQLRLTLALLDQPYDFIQSQG